MPLRNNSADDRCRRSVSVITGLSSRSLSRLYSPTTTVYLPTRYQRKCRQTDDWTLEISEFLQRQHNDSHTVRHPQGRKYTTHGIAITGGPPVMAMRRTNQAMATGKGNKHRKFRDIWTCDFWGIRADKHTNKQTYRHAAWSYNTSHSCEICYLMCGRRLSV